MLQTYCFSIFLLFFWFFFPLRLALLLVLSLIYRQGLFKVDLFLGCFLFDFSHCSPRMPGNAFRGRLRPLAKRKMESKSLWSRFSIEFSYEKTLLRRLFLSRKSAQGFNPRVPTDYSVEERRSTSRFSSRSPLATSDWTPAIAACQLSVYLIFAF